MRPSPIRRLFLRPEGAMRIVVAPLVAQSRKRLRHLFLSSCCFPFTSNISPQMT